MEVNVAASESREKTQGRLRSALSSRRRHRASSWAWRFDNRRFAFETGTTATFVARLSLNAWQASRGHLNLASAKTCVDLSLFKSGSLSRITAA